jgi:hypothetical protein
MSATISVFDRLISESHHKEQAISHYIEYIYNATHCVGAITDNKFYRGIETSTSRGYEDDEVILPAGVIEIESDDSDDGTIEADDVKLVWNKHEYDDYERFSDIYDMTINEYQSMVDTLHRQQDLFFRGKIVLMNMSGFNDDRRGKDSCPVILPYCHSVELIDPTIEQFIEALWLIKSKKFDIWYEMWSSAKIIIDGDKTILKCEFDHGS